MEMAESEGEFEDRYQNSSVSPGHTPRFVHYSLGFILFDYYIVAVLVT